MSARRTFSSPRKRMEGADMSGKHRAASSAGQNGTTVTAQPRHPERASAKTTRVDPAPAAEVQAVQVHRPIVVSTRQGETLAHVGEWLVTDADGSVRVLSDQKFRMHTLHQQLSQLVTRSQRRVNRAS